MLSAIRPLLSEGVQIMECGECGQEVEPNEYHTYEDCLHYLKEKGASPAEFR